jgi:hypothetical protein
MFLAPFFSLMVEHSESFGCAIGVDTHGGANDLVEKMLGFSKCMMEGDFAAFDQSMPFEIGHAAVSVIFKVVRSLGYNEEALKVVQGLLTDNLFPVVSVNKDIFEAASLKPSGDYATAEENTIRANIMAMYAWYKHPDLCKLKFFDYVKPFSYGDDIELVVKEDVLDKFNNFYFRDICKDHLGIKYTSSQKHKDLVAYAGILDCVFLKRRFKYRDDLKRWVAQIDLDSIYKSIQWYIPSKVVSLREQMMSTFESAMYELFLYCEEEQFGRIKSRMEEIFSNHFAFGAEITLPRFDVIKKAICA